MAIFEPFFADLNRAGIRYVVGGADWETTRKAQLRSWLDASPGQRLAWLEEALEIARRSGALAARREQKT